MSTELVRIPSARADQLRALATHKGTTVSNVIGELIAAEIDRLDLAREIGVPGFDVAGLEDGNVLFSASPLGTFTWSKDVALSVADVLSRMTSPERVRAGMLHVDAGLQITRKGNGVRLRNFETEATVTLASPIAVELGALLRQHAAAITID